LSARRTGLVGGKNVVWVVRFEKVKGKEELILTAQDALDEPLSLIQLRKVVAGRLPRVELAELILEVALRTG
jgi:hypothetical protein